MSSDVYNDANFINNKSKVSESPCYCLLKFVASNPQIVLLRYALCSQHGANSGIVILPERSHTRQKN